MAATANEVSTSGLVDTKQSRPARRRDWPEELKRQMVAETLEAGSSVSIVARRHDVNTNQLFKWRREMLPKESSPAEVEGGPMVPVEIVPEPEHHPRRRRMERAGLPRLSSAAAYGCAFVARSRQGRCDRSLSCCDDRLAGGPPDLAGGGCDRHAKRLRQPGGAGPDGARQGSVLGPCVLLPRAPRRSGQAVVV